MSNREFARRLRQFRQRAGFTQEKLAEQSGLSRNYIGLLETKKREPSLSSLLSLSGALSCTLDDLAGMPERNLREKTPPFRTAAVEAKKRKILESLQACDPAALDSIAKIIEACVALAGKESGR